MSEELNRSSKITPEDKYALDVSMRLQRKMDEYYRYNYFICDPINPYKEQNNRSESIDRLRDIIFKEDASYIYDVTLLEAL